jgi:hypothetical protein
MKSILHSLLLLLLPLVLGIGTAAAQTPPPLDTCTIDELHASVVNLPAYQPTATAGFVRTLSDQFTIDGQPFVVRGVNYYPSKSPWRRFLTATDLNAFNTELGLMRNAGFNTLRLYLWNEALFQCPGSGGVPIADAFNRLDAMIKGAAASGFRIIMTLNDMPDLDNYPLYTNPSYLQAQTIFLVHRYKNEAAIMAWDVRNGGDVDYGADPDVPGRFTRDQVINWLAATTAQVRSLDSNHLITAGWGIDANATTEYVDFISFHHFDVPEALAPRFESIQRMTGKPVVLAGFGRSTFERSEEDQARYIQEVIQISEQRNAAGWLVWTAFDFPLTATCVGQGCVSEDNAEHHYGLWTADYKPKAALNAIALG